MSDAVRTPPHSFEAERSVLGGVLIKPAALAEISDLPATAFYLPAHREIWDAMLTLARGLKAIDVLTVGDELSRRGMLRRLEGGPAYLVTMAAEVPQAENIGHYAQIVRDMAAVRDLIQACAEIASRAYGEIGNVEDLVGEALRMVSGIATSAISAESVALPDVIAGALAATEKAGAEPAGVSVKTGLDDLDAVIGGLFAQNVTVVAGITGGGKTGLAMGAVLNAGRCGVPTLVVTLEESQNESGWRMLSAETGIPAMRLARGDVEFVDWKQRLHPAQRELAAMEHVRVLTGVRRIDRIAAAASRWRARYAPKGLGLVVIDYLQLARPDDPRARGEEAVALVSMGAKAISVDLGVAVLALSQLNRDSPKDNREPELHDLRGSGQIEQDASCVVFVYHPPADKDAAGEGDGMREARLLVRKSRMGRPCVVKAWWEGHRRRFLNYETEPSAQLGMGIP